MYIYIYIYLFILRILFIYIHNVLYMKEDKLNYPKISHTLLFAYFALDKNAIFLSNTNKTQASHRNSIFARSPTSFI